MITDEAVQVQASETDRETVRVAPFRSTRKEVALEVLVFLFLIVPSMALSFFVTRQGKVNFVFVSVSTILRDLALGHGYEGSLGVVTVGIMGLAFNLVYLWRRSLVTPMVLHFLQDFIAIIALRYLQGAPST
jgi:hypothetical protein